MTYFKTRLLPRHELDRLVGTEAESIIPDLKKNSQIFVLVVEKNDIIVGTWVLMQCWHAECVWIKEEERGNPVIAGRLIKGMRQLGKTVETREILTSALTEEIENLITKHLEGSVIPGKLFRFPVNL